MKRKGDFTDSEDDEISAPEVEQEEDVYKGILMVQDKTMAYKLVHCRLEFNNHCLKGKSEEVSMTVNLNQGFEIQEMRGLWPGFTLVSKSDQFAHITDQHGFTSQSSLARFHADTISDNKEWLEQIRLYTLQNDSEGEEP
ncbi:hypothetical protein PROFUN_12599 [Planoprotostelium fungivorum]|uniref:Uncharacterized protein n=1 Tax=Planoprotostelium fungivorum TaxID=1890364 RepID=A0A2P6N6B0_9EUKA|nr:hypothetical protein PROFUN_12599 [Planoprotostelium fungivorum]